MISHTTYKRRHVVCRAPPLGPEENLINYLKQCALLIYAFRAAPSERSEGESLLSQVAEANYKEGIDRFSLPFHIYYVFYIMTSGKLIRLRCHLHYDAHNI